MPWQYFFNFLFPSASFVFDLLHITTNTLLMYQVVEVPNVSWEDIGGLENVKRELQEVIEVLALIT